MTMNRRDFIKVNAIAAAAASAGISLPAIAAKAQEAAASTDIRWDKAACRFCGTGCSVLVGTQNGRVVATQGDPDAPVNRGLNCIKGYFLSKIMYGEDRLTQPLLRMKNGKLRQERRIHRRILGRGLRRHGREMEGNPEKRWPSRHRHVRLGPVDDLGRLRRQPS